MYKVSKSSLSRWVNEKDFLKRTRKVKQPCKTINKNDKAVASMVKANPFITMDAIGQMLGLDFGLKRSKRSQTIRFSHLLWQLGDELPTLNITLRLLVLA
jgi:hypothetical protein